MYAIQVNVITEHGEFQTCQQLPTFYLNPRVQGIIDDAHAAEVAESMLRTVNDSPRVKFEISASKVEIHDERFA